MTSTPHDAERLAREKLRMDAYYYSFNETGVPEIDRVLSAVAWAGKAFHNTESWNEECSYKGLGGNTPVEWIQDAANKAASTLTRTEERLKRALEAVEFTMQHSLFFDQSDEAIDAFIKANPNTPVWAMATIQKLCRAALDAERGEL